MCAFCVCVASASRVLRQMSGWDVCKCEFIRTNFMWPYYGANVTVDVWESNETRLDGFTSCAFKMRWSGFRAVRDGHQRTRMLCMVIVINWLCVCFRCIS